MTFAERKAAWLEREAHRLYFFDANGEESVNHTNVYKHLYEGRLLLAAEAIAAGGDVHQVRNASEFRKATELAATI